MIPILSVVGKSDSGKTTRLEKLIAELTRRGYRIATAKHDTHGFEIDREGKDSWRHKHAGATTTIISSPRKVAVISDTTHDLSLSELRERYIFHETILISEGYYRDRHPKIEVTQAPTPQGLLCEHEPTLIAVAGTNPLQLSVPWFHRDDVSGITDFIEKTFLAHPASPRLQESESEKNAPPGIPRHLTGIILAGGKNTRMGTNKAFLEIGGRRIIDRTVELFQRLFSQVILVTNTPLEYAYLDLEIVTDLIPQRGALTGIYTGLSYTSHSHAFVAACDMTFLNCAVINYLTGIRGTYDLVIPHLDDGYHPLHALYAKRCLKYIEWLLQHEKFKIIELFQKVRVREVKPDEILPLDPDLLSFFNLNTPQDLQKIKHLP